MYKLTDIMLQNLEKDLIKFHSLFQGGRCQAWQLEELIVKALRSDFSKHEQIVWKGNGHDIGSDILINNQFKIQIKSGKIEKDKLTLSGHRLGRFKGDLQQITEFVNENEYLIISVPYEEKLSELGKSHIYQLFYFENEFLKINNFKDWEEKKGKKNSVTYFCTNKFGVRLSIHPSMSWQIWWEIPIKNIKNTCKSRQLTIL